MEIDDLQMGVADSMRSGPSESEIENLIALFSANRYEEAEARARKMIQTWPNHVFGWKAFGAILGAEKRYVEALPVLQKTLELLPSDAETHNIQGSVLQTLGRLSEAEASYRCAVEIKPDYHEAHNNLSIVLHDLGRLTEAEASCRRAVEIKPDYHDAHNSLGVVLNELGRQTEAEASCRRAVEIKPDYHEAHSNLGIVLNQLGRQTEAEASYRRAVEIKPDYHKAHNNLGNALRDLGRLSEAEASYRRALEIKPDYDHAHSNALFLMAYCGLNTNEQYLAQARDWEAIAIPPQSRAAARTRTFPNSCREGRRLRIGYVSGDFRTHAVSYFMERILEFHDRSRVEVFAYPTFGRRDTVTDRIQRKVDHWHVLAGVSDEAAVDSIAKHQIDVLIDLSGHTAHNRLGIFARRAAPVQCHYLGYFASTGVTEMDYWIGDSILIPEAHGNQYCERIWRLPRVWVSYATPSDAPDPVWQPSPQGKVCLGSFNNLGKLTKQTVSLWAKVLHRIPNTYLLLKTQELDDSDNRNRILSEFRIQGIPETRIELLGRTADWVTHMSLYSRLDIALDPVGGIAGGTTTCDALWMGVPVVTLAGRRHAERMTSSMLAAIGHDEWAASDEDDYVAIVSRLAADLTLRKKLRFSLRDTMRESPLSDAPGLAHTLEDAFESMFDQWFAQRAHGAR